MVLAGAEAGFARCWSPRHVPLGTFARVAGRRFFETWEAIVRPEPGWTGRAPLLHAREMLSVLAQFGDENGTADRLRAVLTPFRPRA